MNFLNTTDRKNSPLGFISYNATTGQVKKCPVFEPFWEKDTTPDALQCAKHLMDAGYGLIRFNTIEFTPA